MMEISKDQLIEEIKYLITVDGSKTEINPAYLEYFTIEELEEIKIELQVKKENKNEFAKQYVEEIYDKITF